MSLFCLILGVYCPSVSLNICYSSRFLQCIAPRSNFQFDADGKVKVGGNGLVRLMNKLDQDC